LRMKLERIRLESVVLVVCLVAAATVNADEEMKILWEIGTPDNDAREFALGPDRYDEFSEDAFFVVGRSSADRHWPYVHPGPLDRWAGGRRHTFRIFFGVGGDARDGHVRIIVDLVDTHYNAPPVLRFDLNGRTFGFQMPHGGSDASISGHPAAGREYRFSATVPAGILKKGINSLAITNESGSWIVYDWVAFETPGSVEPADVPETAVQSVAVPQILVMKDDALHQVISLSLFNTVKDREVTISVGGGAGDRRRLDRGGNIVELLHPAVETETPVAVEIRAAGETLARENVLLKPVRRWRVYFLPHSHVDIGYTHLQPEVERIQWENIEKGIELARRTADYPEGARFKWNTEVLWAVESYLSRAPEEKRKRFIEAVREGAIGLDALYGNFLTGLARPEELFEFTGFARRLAERYGLRIDSAMITDVPGYTWGMVPALALSGVKYFDPGPNHIPSLPHKGDRIGYTSEVWGDRPFYWVSPSGTEKILVWMPAHGYSWFHDGILGGVGKAGAGPILDYLEELDDGGYPYDMVQLRYTVGSDNGPPDPDLPEFVREWNERYAFPRMIIATTGEMFREFERRFGDRIPEYRGDFTPYWEDGAASSARETALNRNAAERLVQAETLWALIDPEHYPAADFESAWRNVILYTEHTWGAYSSVSDPESDFVAGQWNIKKNFALEADAQSRDLLERAFSEVRARTDRVECIDVYNTSSWPRTDLVVLPDSMAVVGDRVKNDRGEDVPSQRLSTGELAFLAEGIPPLGARRFTFLPGEPETEGCAASSGNVVTNGLLTVVVDEETGAIESLRHSGYAGEFVDRSTGFGLNEYFYLPGKDPRDAENTGAVRIRSGENGPLVASLVIESGAPGCRALTREIRLIDGLERVDMINTVDKEKVTAKESVHFGFPFHVPDGKIRLDIAWAVVRPDVDQLRGANRNFFTVQRWADVSGRDVGVTLATVDAPLMEIGDMNAEVWNLEETRPWLKSVAPSRTLFSYVMNNYWHTNYRAYQEGPVTFRYSMKLHGPFESAPAKRFGIECSQPLLPVPVSGKTPVYRFPAVAASGDVIVTSIRPGKEMNSFVIRLFNAGEAPQEVERPRFAGVWISDPLGVPLSEMPDKLELKGFGIVTLLAVRE